MNQWLVKVQNSLDKALEAVETGVPKENMYMLAPIRYSEEHHMNNDQLIQEMIESNEIQFKQGCKYDSESRKQFKFHYVSSYLYCYVIAGKIDEMKYDRIMEYVNDRVNLFTEDYSYE